MFLLAGFDAGGGDDPDDHHEGDDRESEIRVIEGEWCGDEVEAERYPVFALGVDVFLLQFAGEAEASADSQAQKQVAESGHDHRGDVQRDREGVDLFFKEVGGEEGEQREAEEECEVGVEDALIGLGCAVDEVWWFTQ